MKQFRDYNYFVSENGEVFSKDKKLTPRKHNGGYLRVSLCKDGKVKDFYIHRLVAELYVENKNPEKYKEINHLDSNKTNNRKENLEWCDGTINHYHSLFAGTKTCGRNSHFCKLKEEQVLEIRKDNSSHKKIAEKFNISRQYVGMLKNNKKWKHL